MANPLANLGYLKNFFFAIAFGVVILLKHESIPYTVFISLGFKFFLRMDIYSIWFIIPSMKFEFRTLLLDIHHHTIIPPPACFTVFVAY